MNDLRTCTHCGEETVLNGIGECVGCSNAKLFMFSMEPNPPRPGVLTIQGAADQELGQIEFGNPEHEKRIELLSEANDLAERLSEVLVKLNKIEQASAHLSLP